MRPTRSATRRAWAVSIRSPTATVSPQYPGTYLTVTAPNGATTGYVTVTTSAVTLKSNKKFRVIPLITGSSPACHAPLVRDDVPPPQIVVQRTERET